MRGFTVIEAVLFIAVVGVVASAGYMTVVSTQESARENKLQSDVAQINSALQLYMASGGDLPEGTTAQQAITKLKTRAKQNVANKTMGATGSFIDPRIEAVFQSDEESGPSDLRAVWDSGNRRFDIVRGGGGIREFRLNDSLAGEAPVLEDRTMTLAASDVTSGQPVWVWDYADGEDTTPPLGSYPSVYPRPAYANPTDDPTQQLSPPQFSVSPGSRQLSEFDLYVTLTNPNPTGVSQIFYALGDENGMGVHSVYHGEALMVTPNTRISAYARSIDPDNWSDSTEASGDYEAQVVPLSINLVSPTWITYEQAGGAMLSGTQAAVYATVTLQNTSSIPAKYLNSSNFQIYYLYGTGDPTTTGTAGPEFSETFVSPQIDLALARWGSTSSLQIRAVARALNTELFTTSQVVSATAGISKTALAAPTIDPPTGQRSANLAVTISLTGNNYPEGYRIYYTTDGTDPGTSAEGLPTSAAATLYSGPFQPGAGNALAVTARVYGPAGYEHWFTPSGTATATYTASGSALASGALVGSATLNSTFNGDIVIAYPADGSLSDITYNSNARINGSLYVPGTPSVQRSNGTVWSPATDSQFAKHIGGEVPGEPVSPRVVDLGGDPSPSNYQIMFNKSSYITGKIYRQIERYTLDPFDMSEFPAKDSNGWLSLDNPPPGPISASQYANVNINTSRVGQVTLLPGDFGSLNANNGTAFVLGDPDDPTNVMTYSIESLNLNSSSDLVIVGPVVINVKNDININTGSVLGNSAHPEWLQINMWGGNLQGNSGSSVYGRVFAPNNSVIFNAGSTLNGSISAKNLTINSEAVIFSLPPPTSPVYGD